jgi:hypothetical protein
LTFADADPSKMTTEEKTAFELEVKKKVVAASEGTLQLDDVESVTLGEDGSVKLVVAQAVAAATVTQNLEGDSIDVAYNEGGVAKTSSASASVEEPSSDSGSSSSAAASVAASSLFAGFVGAATAMF